MAQGTANFLLWNNGLVRHFFQPEMAGRPVYVYVTRETLSAVGERNDLDPDEFVEAVKNGPPWVTREGLCQRALQACSGWRERDLELPPYVAFLGLFVLAAGVEGDFAPHAYYPRLRQLIGEEMGGMLPSFDRMLELWDDLERWATMDRKGELGLFEAKIVGGWIHVGLPLAQTILSEEERNSLPRIFGAAGFDGSSVPPDDEVVRGLRVHGGQYFRPRTQRLVEGRGDEERLSALVDVVVEELAEWDGRVEADAPDGAVEAFGALRLCATWDPVSQQVRTSLRCRIGGEFPEGTLTLSGAGLEGEVECEEAMGGWSTKLRSAVRTDPLDGRSLPWSEGAMLSDARRLWRFGLRPSPVRVLVSGTQEGIPGLVEVSQLPRKGSFYILFQAEIADAVREWGPTACVDFEEKDLESGLPEGWLMASAEAMKPGGDIPAPLDVVAPSSRVRLRLVGGVRSGPGNNYFSFAPPAIRIEGGRGDERLWCGEVELVAEVGEYEIPRWLPTETRIVIEVRRGSNQVQRRSLYLTGDFSWNVRRTEGGFDRWGRQVSEGEGAPVVCGARVSGVLDTADYRVDAMQAVAEANKWKRRTFLVGRRPGEITRWPQEPYPRTWAPVWAIPMETQGTALFCGADPERCRPVAGRCVDKSSRRWKQVLWTWRYRIVPPTHPVLRRLWYEFREVARRA